MLSLCNPPVLVYYCVWFIIWCSFITHRCSCSQGCGSVMQVSWYQWSLWSSLGQCPLWPVSKSSDPTATPTTIWYLQVQYSSHYGDFLKAVCSMLWVIISSLQDAALSLIRSPAAQRYHCVTPQGAAAWASTGATCWRPV